MPVALVVAARAYLDELQQAIDQSKIDVVTTEFGRVVPLAAKYQPNLILVAFPPIEDALKTCQRLLENCSTRSIPISLISLGHNRLDDTLVCTPAEAVLDAFPYRQVARASKEKPSAEGPQPVTSGNRQKQLLNIIDMLRYAEKEVLGLKIETSAVLLTATIADLLQNLE
ncbi:hypothetical protein [Bradyrhizobium sp. USDA 4508]